MAKHFVNRALRKSLSIACFRKSWAPTKRISATNRKQAIERFAKQHALAVTFYDVGLCAIFEKPHQANSHTVVVPLKLKPIIQRRGKKSN